MSLTLNLFLGPVFTRERLTLPRRGRTYVARAAVAATALVLMGTAWQVLVGTQQVRNVGDLARFGSIVFQMLAPLLLAAVTFLAALSTAAGVAYEKDRRTFDLLLLTNLSNTELVFGKLAASLLGVLNVFVAAVPVLALTMVMGGVGLRQIAAVTTVTAAAIVLAGSLGSTIALWREKTFQTLAATALAIVVWTGLWEAAGRGLFGEQWGGDSPAAWAAAASPWHAVAAAAQPFADERSAIGPFSRSAAAHVVFALAASCLLNLVAVVRVRVWNPTREILPRSPEAETTAAAAPHRWSLAAIAKGRSGAADAAAVAVSGRGLRRSRTVGDNPILWREVRTWAYGRRVLVIRLAYLAIGAASWWGLSRAAAAGIPSPPDVAAAILPAAVLSLFLINMQAVTAVTAERDARALDLLLVTDLTPKEFVFGKLGGVLYNTKEMVVWPLVLCGALWHYRACSGEASLQLAAGWVMLTVFAAVLGIHVGMHYAESRRAVAVSLGTSFFLIAGVAVSMRIMVAFSGSFQAQLQPFLATIVGGGAGLYAALGRRNPSPAITLASFALPLATFYAITSYLLGAPLAALLAVAGAYGFATTALLVPAVFEFDVATGRTTGEERE
jgi:ABC-type transport system involved in multi-copper enzyme maturation permease subunit